MTPKSVFLITILGFLYHCLLYPLYAAYSYYSIFLTKMYFIVNFWDFLYIYHFMNVKETTLVISYKHLEVAYLK